MFMHCLPEDYYTRRRRRSLKDAGRRTTGQIDWRSIRNCYTWRRSRDRQNKDAESRTSDQVARIGEERGARTPGGSKDSRFSAASHALTLSCPSAVVPHKLIALPLARTLRRTHGRGSSAGLGVRRSAATPVAAGAVGRLRGTWCFDTGASFVVNDGHHTCASSANFQKFTLEKWARPLGYSNFILK